MGTDIEQLREERRTRKVTPFYQERTQTLPKEKERPEGDDACTTNRYEAACSPLFAWKGDFAVLCHFSLSEHVLLSIVRNQS